MTEEELLLREEQTEQNIESKFIEQGNAEPPKRELTVKSLSIGKSFYGEGFDGWHRVGEIKDLILPFKEYYYARKIQNSKESSAAIARAFNEDIVFPMKRSFYPYPSQLKMWTKKWNTDIQVRQASVEEVTDPKREVQQVIKTRRERIGNEVDYIVPDERSLEAGTQTLAGELVNDALQFHRDTQDMEDEFETDELIKRKMYTVNVLAHVSKMLHNKASLLLKASAEKRENTNFLMTLMKRATAGVMTDDELAVLGDDAAIPIVPEQPTP